MHCLNLILSHNYIYLCFSAMDIPPTTNTTANRPESARQVPPSLKHPSSSTGDLLPGIDLDAVALMMQGGKGN